jgi:hypothetical protein
VRNSLCETGVYASHDSVSSIAPNVPYGTGSSSGCPPRASTLNIFGARCWPEFIDE